MTSATEELRRLLDDAGVEWGNVRNDGSPSDYVTEWELGNRDSAIATEWAVGGGLSVEICRHQLTPAQAVEAALGRGKCKYESVNQSVNLESGMVYGFEHVLTCGHSFLSTRSMHVKFCPECGREIE